MGILTDEMKQLIGQHRLGFVATVDRDGTPNLSPKGTIAVLDDNHILFGEIRSSNTVSNLQRNLSLEINVVNPLSRKGFRFKGAAQYIKRDSPAFDKLYPKIHQHFEQWGGLKERVRGVVVLKVQRALSITSPAYDIGVSEEALLRHFGDHFQDIVHEKLTELTAVDFELVSFKLCPFVQRSVITLLQKQVKFRIRYVDLSAPPDWFLSLSPTKKVPLMVVDGDKVIFESAVINELIDELTPARLHPADPIQRARNRSWIEFGSNCLMDTLHMTTAATEEAFRNVVNANKTKLEILEAKLGDGPFFNGADFSLVDAAYAPFFVRLGLIDHQLPVFDKEALPKVAQWSDRLLALPSVINSVVPDFPELYEDSIWKRQGYLAHVLPGADKRIPVQGRRY
ncbi:pyridoxamine 5'-phosphate oxidase family protein [uncultured Amphritea sp.]|uniref:pyridoxamine 5'-phosphate oxidase family protein n=1 Tax=uncultured Amphritea sp. TaxID=981605 RepID=UPI0025D4C0B7|nr:pyridoxamine 5'-phosphate oxidase family protein [uncultured Amphritea sp.]